MKATQLLLAVLLQKIPSARWVRLLRRGEELDDLNAIGRRGWQGFVRMYLGLDVAEDGQEMEARSFL